MSALGPKMTGLAGEIADGVLFNWFTTEFERQSGELVTAAASQAGRPQPLIMSYVRCGLLPHAQHRLQERAVRMGISAHETCVSGTDAATLQTGIAAHEQVLDETIVRAITPDDRAASILELLRAWNCCVPAPPH